MRTREIRGDLGTIEASYRSTFQQLKFSTKINTVKSFNSSVPNLSDVLNSSFPPSLERKLGVH